MIRDFLNFIPDNNVLKYQGNRQDSIDFRQETIKLSPVWYS